MEKQLTDLDRKREAVRAAFERDPEREELDRLDRERAELEAALQAERDAKRHTAVLALRKREKAAFEAFCEGCTELWALLLELDKVYQAEGALGARPLTGVPPVLVRMLDPGWHGTFRTWAHTNNISKV